MSAFIHQKFLDSIEPETIRFICSYMVGEAAALKDFTCHPNKNDPEKGTKKHSFRYKYKNGKVPFSFIINKHDGLLFYFRKSSFKHLRKDDIQRLFPNAQENPAGEITVRIENIKTAHKIVSTIKGIF